MSRHSPERLIDGALTIAKTSGLAELLVSPDYCSGFKMVYAGAKALQVNSGAGYGLAMFSPSFKRVHITHCLSYGNTGIATTPNWSGSGIFVGETDTATIEYSVAYSNGASNISPAGGPVGIWAGDVTNVTIQYNEAYLTHSGNGVDATGFDFDGGVTNSVMQGNYAHNNDGAGFFFYQYGDGFVTAWNNNTLRFNVSENDGGVVGVRAGYPVGGIMLANDDVMTGVYVYGNTVYNTLNRAIGLGGVNSGTMTGRVANNIFSVTGSQPLVTASGNPSSLLFTNNDYFTTGSSASLFSWNSVNYASLALWKAGTGQDSVGVSSNPLLTSPSSGGTCDTRNFPTTTCPSAYTLQGGSPMLSVGVNLTQAPYSLSVGSQDFYGNPIPTGVGTGYNIGAY